MLRQAMVTNKGTSTDNESFPMLKRTGGILDFS